MVGGLLVRKMSFEDRKEMSGWYQMDGGTMNDEQVFCRCRGVAAVLESDIQSHEIEHGHLGVSLFSHSVS